MCQDSGPKVNQLRCRPERHSIGDLPKKFRDSFHLRATDVGPAEAELGAETGQPQSATCEATARPAGSSIARQDTSERPITLIARAPHLDLPFIDL